MKKILFLALAVLAVFPYGSVCAAAMLTTVFYDGKEFLYLGAKKQEQGQEASSAVAVVDSKDMGHETIPLPASIAKRDVIGVIPEGPKIFVLTQLGNSKEDDPLLSVYNRETKEWKDIQSVDCPIFTKVSFKAKSLVFSCEHLTKRGKSRVKKKVLSLGAERIHHKGSMHFPEFLIHYKKMEISLEGLALSWDRLHIKKDAEDKVLHASELFAAAPPPAPAPLVAAPAAAAPEAANPPPAADSAPKSQ